MIKLDLQSRIPLYEQLEEQIIRLSLLGVLDEHEQLPSVRALARDVGVNPNTVAKSLSGAGASGHHLHRHRQGKFRFTGCAVSRTAA